METAQRERSGRSTTAAVDRRAHVRVKLDAAISARRIGGDDTLTIEEASIAGFSTKSPVPFEPESSYHFRLSDPAGQVAVVGAVCRYCTVLEGGDSPSYLVGFELEPLPARRVELIFGASLSDAASQRKS